MRNVVRCLCLFFVLLLFGAMLPATLFAAPAGMTTVYLSASSAKDRAALLALLNGGTTDNTKKYVLRSNFQFSASELRETYFPGEGRESRTRYFTFLSSLNGNGNSIVVDIGKDETSRPLFHTVGELSGKRVRIENLKVEYRGDVKVSAFMSGYARNADFSNIEISVAGDIVASADYFNKNINFYAHAFGYSAENCGFKNVKVSVGSGTNGGVIGQTAKTIAERLALDESNRSATYAYGFFRDMTNVSAEKITITAKSVNATGNAGARAAGFAESVAAGKENQIEAVQIGIRETIVAIQQSSGSAETVGAYGFAGSFDTLSKSAVTAGGIHAKNNNVLTESDFSTEAAGFGGAVGNGERRIFENTVAIEGSVTADAGGIVRVAGGYIVSGMGRDAFLTEKNTVEVTGDLQVMGGNLLKQRSGAASNLSVSGFAEGAEVSSSGDKIHVAGMIRAEAEGDGGAAASGYAAKTGLVEDAVVVIGGIRASAPGDAAKVSGFTSSVERSGIHRNNYLRVDSSFDLSALLSADAAGYAADAENQAQIEGCTVDIAGIYAALTGDAPEVTISGFVGRNNGGVIDGNTAVIRGNFEVRAENAEKGDATAALFLVEMNGGSVAGNAAYQQGNSVVGGLHGTVIKSSFIGILSSGSVEGNGVAGEAGVAGTAEGFFIGALDSGAAGYTVRENHYVAMYGNERVSHPISFSASSDAGGFSVELVPLSAPLDSILVNTLSDTEADYTDKLPGTLSVMGGGYVEQSANAGSLHLRRKPLLESIGIFPVAGIRSKSGEETVIRDILGIREGEAKTISGLIFYDNDNNGRFDATDSYIPNISFEVMAFDKPLRTVTTGNDGRFSFSMPLASALRIDYHLKMDLPDGYASSQLSANKFRNGVAFIPEYQYEKDYTNVNGAVTPEKAYTVEFFVNGGSAVAQQKVYESEKAGRPDNPLRAGYSFSGWYVDSMYSREYDFQLPVYENLKLYAKWVEAAGVSIPILSFHANGGMGGVQPAAFEYKAGVQIIIPEETPEKEGQVFSGWLSDYDGAVYNPGDSFTMPGVSVELKAQWENQKAAGHMILFDSVGGSRVFPIVDALMGETITPPDDPTKEGSIFDGWYTDSDYQDVWDFSADTVNGDMTLYAKWRPEGGAGIGEENTGNIGSSDTPLSGLYGGGWGIANLLLLLIGFMLSIFSVAAAVRVFYRLEGRTAVLLLALSFLCIAVSLIAAVLFLAASNFSAAPSPIDRWTWVMVLLAAAQGIVLILIKRLPGRR